MMIKQVCDSFNQPVSTESTQPKDNNKSQAQAQAAYVVFVTGTNCARFVGISLLSFHFENIIWHMGVV